MPKDIPGVMGEFKRGQLHSGSSRGPVVTDPKQAVAIALSEQRQQLPGSQAQAHGESTGYAAIKHGAPHKGHKTGAAAHRKAPKHRGK